MVKGFLADIARKLVQSKVRVEPSGVRRNPDLHGVLCSAVDPINVRTDIGLVSEMVGVVEGID